MDDVELDVAPKLIRSSRSTGSAGHATFATMTTVRDIEALAKDFREAKGCVKCRHMKIASSALGKELHAVCLSDAGTLFHCIRHEDGAWDKWETLHPGGIFRDVSCASVESALHVIGMTDAGVCVHRIRDKNGEWTEFSDLVHQPMFEG